MTQFAKRDVYQITYVMGRLGRVVCLFDYLPSPQEVVAALELDASAEKDKLPTTHRQRVLAGDYSVVKVDLLSKQGRPNHACADVREDS